MKSKNILIISGVALVVICLFFGYALGRIIKTKEIEASKAESIHANMDHSATETKHEHLEVAKNRLNPNLKLVATKDTMGGYNLNIQTSNFYFTPEKAGGEPTQNTGHAHLYINDVKIGRVYGPWMYLSDDKFKAGTNTITVSLNANDHSTWLNNKTRAEISTTTEIFITK